MVTHANDIMKEDKFLFQTLNAKVYFSSVSFLIFFTYRHSVCLALNLDCSDAMSENDSV